MDGRRVTWSGGIQVHVPLMTKHGIVMQAYDYTDATCQDAILAESYSYVVRCPVHGPIGRVDCCDLPICMEVD